MKRVFPISMSVLAVMAVNAISSQEMLAQDTNITPEVLPGFPIQNLSPNGAWAVADAGDYNPMVIIDLNTFTMNEYYETYSGGAGNYISNNGIVVGRNAGTETASYWSDGAWTELPTGNKAVMSFANGITPNGDRIVGTISPDNYSGDFEGMMLVPCYWDVNPDGSYGSPVMLPHPSVDPTNRTPQYITAVVISADGKTIAGQVVDYLGMVAQPIIYQQSSYGAWSYKLLVNDLFFPSGFTIPPYPGDAPTKEEFMSAEELEEYADALEEWEANGSNQEYPVIDDFMSYAGKVAYNEALSKWDQEYREFESAFWTWMAVVPNFTYNNVFLSSDAKYYATTDAKFFVDELNGIYIKDFKPYLIDIENNTYKSFPAVDDIDIMVSSLADDGSVLGQWNDEDYGIFNGYILPAGADAFMPLSDYVKEINPETYEWMVENMTHEYERYTEDLTGQYTAEILATGIPHSTPDMSLIGFAQSNFWSFSGDESFYGYLIGLPSVSGVEKIEADSRETDVQYVGSGLLMLKGDVTKLDIYDLSGMQLMSVKSPSTHVSTNLPKGIYLINVTTGEGSNLTKKLIIK